MPTPVHRCKGHDVFRKKCPEHSIVVACPNEGAFLHLVLNYRDTKSTSAKLPIQYCPFCSKKLVV
ncbi:hypothetical protein COU77_02780 [Candidatus Peregrinibacteria bacterium CG10_big_fil_rev_8_21_14_0_10_49_16]|nr:MAG: hypothetical protein COW95_02290 [Candidatus Peregrinibacteria bacterium CG22_combo_CG10-13_8_21_14_all_49_11]PIR51963.1 MAG: hypothetical protein COU77_02780 [Candidatus Peregrinibacteria bacterium CG10_big_fil_rev_8_21_14_0_10_49_16]